MNEVFCPFCSARQSPPHAAAGQTARCSSCGKTFMVPGTPLPRASAPPGRLATVTPLTTATPHAAPLPRPTMPLGGVEPGIPLSGVAAMPVHAAPGHAVPGFAAARPAISGPTPVAMPVAASSPTSGSAETGDADDAGSSSISIILVGGTVCLILGGLLLLVVILKLAKGSGEHDRPAVVNTDSPSSTQSVPATPANSPSPGWSHVPRGSAIDINSLEIEVQHVDFGEVWAQDDRNRVVVLDRKNYLQVYLSIKNLGAHSVSYTSWQGNSFTVEGKQVRATLVDDRGRSYMQGFAQVAGLKGHTPRAILASQEEAEDVVVFTIPERVARRTIRYFRLELPAEACGGSGVYRFEIPRQSIQGF